MPAATAPTMLDRVPPNDISLEQCVLGSMILDPASAVDIASTLLTGGDFYGDIHGQVFDAIVSLHELGQPVGDVQLLLTKFRRYGLVDSGFGAAAIAQCVNATPTASNIEFYAEEVAKMSRHRRTIQVVTKAIGKLYEEKPDVDGITEKLVSQILNIQSQKKIEILTLRESAVRTHQRIQNAVTLGTGHGIPTGIRCLDEAMGGLCESEVIILAARPGQGKTAMAMQIASNMAIDGNQVLVVSLEMKDTELTTRLLCAVSGVDSKSIRNGTITQEQVDRIGAFVDSLSYPVSFYAPETATVRNIVAAVRLAMSRGPIAAVVIDYVQLIVPSDYRKPRHEQLEEVSKLVKNNVAREFGIPVLLLCQLNRDGGGRVPRAEDLKGSGSLEQDADSIIAIHTPEESKGTKELHILKNRHGGEGVLKVRWHASATKFEDFEYEEM